MGLKPGEFPRFTGMVKEIWNENAAWWDDQLGDGNAFQDELVEPAQDRLLGELKGLHVLDLGCGAGRYSRRMARQGARVTAVDISENFLARARARTSSELSIVYRQIDISRSDELDELVKLEESFDAAVCTMALMNVAEIVPVFRGLARVTKPGARFVATVLHPCFQSPSAERIAETSAGTNATRTGLKLCRYGSAEVHRGEGVEGQPTPTVYFHRPLEVLLGAAFASGFVLSGLEEPRLSGDNAKILSWRSLSEFPPVLALRFSRGGGLPSSEAFS